LKRRLSTKSVVVAATVERSRRHYLRETYFEERVP